MKERMLVLVSGILLGLGVTSAMAADECFLDQSLLSRSCERMLRAEVVEKYCQDLNIKDPLALGNVCADRVKKAGGQIHCRNQDDIDRLLPKVVGYHCKMGDQLILQDPTKPMWPGRSDRNWVGTSYDQVMLTRFCARADIKRLDVGDYTCVIDRGI